MRRSVLPVLLILVTVSMTALLAAAPTLASPPYAPEKLLWTGPASIGAPSVWGTGEGAVTAWESSGAGGDWDIVVNTLQGTNVVLPLGTGDQRHPTLLNSLDSQFVFFEDDRAGDWDIYAVDLNELPDVGEPYALSATPIATGRGDQLDPAALDYWVVYEDNSRGNWDICAYNLVTKVRRRIVTNTASQCDPAVSGGQVVFADRRNGNWDIYKYDLYKGKLRQLTRNKAAQTKPQIGPGWVVYQDRRNGNWDIYACTFGSVSERRLTSSTADQTDPAIDQQPTSSARAVVYKDVRSGRADVYLYELVSRVTKQVTDDVGNQTYPSISRDQVAWRDDRAAAPGIYGCRLQFPKVHLWGSEPTIPAYNSTVTVDGELDLEDAAYAGQRVYVLERGTKRWVTLPGPSSSFDVAVPNLVRRVTLRAIYPGDANHLPAVSTIFAVKPEAYLSKPVLNRLPGRNVDGRWVTTDDCRVTGYLKPRHKAGTEAVTISCYRYKQASPWWELIKTVNVRIKDYRSFSKYSAIITLKGGPWKVKAFCKGDTDHFGTESSFSNTIGLGL